MEQYNDPDVWASALANLANIAQERGDDQAIIYYQQSYDSFVKLDDPYNQGTALCNIGLWYADHNNPEQARVHYEQPLRLFEALQVSERIEWLKRKLADLPQTS